MTTPKLYAVTISSSSEYGCSGKCVGVFSTKKQARKALSKEYKYAKSDMNSDCEEISFAKSKDSFEISDYDCSYICVSGQIDEVTLN